MEHRGLTGDEGDSSLVCCMHCGGDTTCLYLATIVNGFNIQGRRGGRPRRRRRLCHSPLRGSDTDGKIFASFAIRANEDSSRVGESFEELRTIRYSAGFRPNPIASQSSDDGELRGSGITILISLHTGSVNTATIEAHRQVWPLADKLSLGHDCSRAVSYRWPTCTIRVSID